MIWLNSPDCQHSVDAFIMLVFLRRNQCELNLGLPATIKYLKSIWRKIIRQMLFLTFVSCGTKLIRGSRLYNKHVNKKQRRINGGTTLCLLLIL